MLLETLPHICQPASARTHTHNHPHAPLYNENSDFLLIKFTSLHAICICHIANVVLHAQRSACSANRPHTKQPEKLDFFSQLKLTGFIRSVSFYFERTRMISHCFFPRLAGEVFELSSTGPGHGANAESIHVNINKMWGECRMPDSL